MTVGTQCTSLVRQWLAQASRYTQQVMPRELHLFVHLTNCLGHPTELHSAVWLCGTSGRKCYSALKPHIGCHVAGWTDTGPDQPAMLLLFYLQVHQRLQVSCLTMLLSRGASSSCTSEYASTFACPLKHMGHLCHAG